MTASGIRARPSMNTTMRAPHGSIERNISRAVVATVGLLLLQAPAWIAVRFDCSEELDIPLVPLMLGQLSIDFTMIGAYSTTGFLLLLLPKRRAITGILAATTRVAGCMFLLAALLDTAENVRVLLGLIADDPACGDYSVLTVPWSPVVWLLFYAALVLVAATSRPLLSRHRHSPSPHRATEDPG